MDAESTIIYGQLFEHERTDEEKQFLTELFLKTDGNFAIIAKFIPDSITVESMLEAFETLSRHVFNNVPSHNEDEATAELVLPQVKLMTLLPKTRHDLFMLLTELVFHFGSYPNDRNEKLSGSVINMAYGSMIGMLKRNQCRTWGIAISEKIRESTEEHISEGFTMEDQLDIITMLDCMRNVKDEGARRNIAYLLVERNVVKDEAIAAYRDQLEERYIRNSNPLMREKSKVFGDKVLNAFTLAQIGKIGAVKVFDTYLANNKERKAAKKS